MKMNKTKKGFTIVELVIVIAIIAILAAVLIPTFSNLIKRANVSKDNQLVRNLNTALIADAAINGKHETMQSALDAVAGAGFLVDRINKAAAKDNEILWDQVNDVFCYLNDGEVEYIPSSVEEEKKLPKNDYRLWKIYDSVPALADQTYSIYLAGTETTGTVNVNVGVDVGSNSGIAEINYTGTATPKTDVRICTNGGKLTVNAKDDNVLHYGYADSVNVIDVATASYHENGEVKFLEVAAGHIVLEADAEVSAVHFTATGSGNDAKFENADGKKISIDLSKVNTEDISFSRDAVTIAENGTYVAEVTTESTEYIWLFGNGIKEQMVATTTEGAIAVNGSLKANITAGAEDGSVAEQIANPAKRNDAGKLVDENNEVIDLTDVDFTKADALEDVEVVVEEVASKGAVQTGVTLFAGGTGTESDPYMIRNREQFENISNLWETYVYYKVDTDSELWHTDSLGKYMDASGWETVYLNGVLEGNGLRIKGLSDTLFELYYADLSKVNRIKNLDIECGIYKISGTAAVINYTAIKTELYGISVHGIIQGTELGSFIRWVHDHGNDMYLKIENCFSDATLVGITKANGFFSHIYLTTRTTSDSIQITNSQFIGSIMSANEGAYIGDNTGGTRKGGITFEVDEDSKSYNGVSLVDWESYESSSSNRRVALDPYVYTLNGVSQKQTLNRKTDLSLPEKYNSFEATKNTSATSAKAVLVICPNGNGTTVTGGSFTGTYMQEASLQLVDGKFITNDIKYFDIEVNGNTKVVTKLTGNSGLSSDGRTFNVINNSYNNEYSSAYVMIVQYNGSAVVEIDVYNFPIQ